MTADEYGLNKYPWERQEGETSNNYAAFVTYRDMGIRRTLRKAAIRFYEIPENEYDPRGGKIRTLEKWSAQYRWVQRAELYDDFMQAQADAEDVEAIKDMRKRHVQLMTVIQSKAVTYLNTVTEAQLAKMTPDQLMRMLDLAIKNERIARGVPDTITGVTNAKGEAVEIQDVTQEALERKFEAWKLAHDPDNTIEKGEPDGTDQEQDDMLAEILEEEGRAHAAEEGDALAWPDDEEPFPETGDDDPDDDGE